MQRAGEEGLERELFYFEGCNCDMKSARADLGAVVLRGVGSGGGGGGMEVLVLLVGGSCEQQHLRSTETVSVSWGGGGTRVACVSEMGPQMLFQRSGACVVVLPAGGGESDRGGGD